MTSEMTVNNSCLEMTTAIFGHSSKPSARKDEKLLYCNMPNDDNIPLVYGMPERVLNHDEQLTDDGVILRWRNEWNPRWL